MAGRLRCFFSLITLSIVSTAAWADTSVPSVENLFQMSLVSSMAADSMSEEDSLATADLGEIDRKLNNPLTDLAISL